LVASVGTHAESPQLRQNGSFARLRSRRQPRPPQQELKSGSPTIPAPVRRRSGAG
jgi:hypothetical protein